MLVTMDINNIKIPTKYRNTPPKKEKIYDHIVYYNDNDKLMKDILITPDGKLVDGYCDYIVAVCYGIKTVQCKLNTKRLKPDARGSRKIHKKSDKRKLIFVLQKGKCAICGKQLQINDYTSVNDYLTLDHIFPISRGGISELTNLQGLCKQCNAKKGNKVEEGIFHGHGESFVNSFFVWS